MMMREVAQHLVADHQPITLSEFRLLARLLGAERELVNGLLGACIGKRVRIGSARIQCQITGRCIRPYVLGRGQ